MCYKTVLSSSPLDRTHRREPEKTLPHTHHSRSSSSSRRYPKMTTMRVNKKSWQRNLTVGASKDPERETKKKEVEEEEEEKKSAICTALSCVTVPGGAAPAAAAAPQTQILLE